MVSNISKLQYQKKSEPALNEDSNVKPKYIRRQKRQSPCNPDCTCLYFNTNTCTCALGDPCFDNDDARNNFRSNTTVSTH